VRQRRRTRGLRRAADKPEMGSATRRRTPHAGRAAPRRRARARTPTRRGWRLTRRHAPLPLPLPLGCSQNGRVLHQFTQSQDQALQALQQQAAAAQAQAAQAAGQLQNAQTQVAVASDQLSSQTSQLSTLNTAQQSNVQELNVLLPTSPTGAPAPGPEAAAGAWPVPTPARLRARAWAAREGSGARAGTRCGSPRFRWVGRARAAGAASCARPSCGVRARRAPPARRRRRCVGGDAWRGGQAQRTLGWRGARRGGRVVSLSCETPRVRRAAPRRRRCAARRRRPLAPWPPWRHAGAGLRRAPAGLAPPALRLSATRARAHYATLHPTQTLTPLFCAAAYAVSLCSPQLRLR
jgi:hypothetical protein